MSPCHAAISPLFIYISQLLRDLFFVSQQPPISEPPSHYSMLQHQQTAAPIIVVTVLLGDNHHHHCREQEELRIVAGAPDPAPPCRGHRCWLLYLELFILIWLGVIIEPCSAPTRHLVTPNHILEVKLYSKSGLELELAAARARHGAVQ